MLSQENKVSEFCMDAVFLGVVEIGQYVMTKDTGEQFFARACREYTLPRSDEPKGWIHGNTRIGPVLEITTRCPFGKHGVEIRIWYLRKDNSQSWVRISYGNRIRVNVQWHLLWQKRQQRWMFGKCRSRQSTFEKIRYWTMVIHWTRFWKEVVFFREQSTRSLGQHCGANVAGICRKWTSYFPCNDSSVQEFSQEQRFENCQYISLQMETQLIRFFALKILSFSSVSTEQWQLYVQNLRAIKMDRVNLRFWWFNQVFSAKSRQKFLCWRKTHWIIKLYGNSTWNESNHFHQKEKWVDSV